MTTRERQGARSKAAHEVTPQEAAALVAATLPEGTDGDGDNAPATATAPVQDTGYAPPPGEWAFDEEVTRVFDDMLRRSIPQYDTMRRACFSLGQRFVRPGAAVVDLGCSRGEALAPYVERFGPANRYVGVEVSEPMLAAARERFSRERQAGVVEIASCDLRTGYPDTYACLTLCVLTLQFTPLEHRPYILQRIADHTLKGGALLLVEKVLGGTAPLDEKLVGAYYDLKREHGYTQEEIDRKRLALEGKLVPVTAAWNEDLLRRAGFAQVECFWRLYNFAGWLAIKDKE